MIPSHCKKLRLKGFKIRIETGAGEAAGYSDKDYQKFGAEVVSCKEIWENSEIIMKIRTLQDNEELGYHEADAL